MYRCAQSPVGELLYKKGPGVAVLIMSVYKFPGMSAELSFQCHVRVCNRNLDNYCSTVSVCMWGGGGWGWGGVEGECLCVCGGGG